MPNGLQKTDSYKNKKRSINGLARRKKEGKDNNRHFVTMESGTQLTGIRGKLFLDRYSLKDKSGKSTEKYPEQSWRRMAWALSQVEKTKSLRKKWEEKYYSAMLDFKLVPAGRIWCAAGTGTRATMGNCFVLPNPEDTRSGIIKTLEQLTEISARGGGVGFNISTLRPKGSYLKKVNGTTSGAVSWASLYSIATHEIIQQGGTRRGALMMMMWDWHPDIEEFITVKKKQGKLLGANLSVCVSDEFMDSVETDKDWQLKFPDTDYKKYRSEWRGDIKDWEKKGYPVRTYKNIKARKLWDMICESAWASAEPGVVFMDRYNKMNNTYYFEKNIATNPCGEQGLPAWGVCNLSSINLAAFVNKGKFDFDGFKETIKVGVRFLDNVIDTEKYIFKDIEKVQKRERRIGLGTMGLADALIKMKIRYSSKKSLSIIDKIFRTLRDTAYEASIDLAKERGVFEMFDSNKYLQGGFIKTIPNTIRNKITKNGIRNAFLITEAPTGKISLLAGVSSGIEPVFSFSYKQKDRLGERTMYHSLYQEWIDENGDKNIPDYFVVADDLTPEEHVTIQALIQKYTDSSISKTVNAPKTHSIDDVKKLYKLAYKTGCKGISYMREGSREGTLVRNKEEEANGESKKPVIWQRPMKVSGATYKVKTPVGTAFVTINHDSEGMPMEMFINVGKAGSDIQAMAEALGRLISKTLKLNGHINGLDRAKMIVDQLKGIGGARPVGFGVHRVRSLPDALAKVIMTDLGVTNYDLPKKNLVDKNKSPGVILPDSAGGDYKAAPLHLNKNADICPDCGNATLVSEMGCKTCHGCGYSEC